MMERRAVIVYDEYMTEIGRYPSLKECAREFGTRHANVHYWIRNGLMRNGCFFRYEEGEATVPPCLLKREKLKERSIDPDESDWRTIHYEVRNIRVSITPCPYKRYPKPMVGSAACQGCGSFKGRDRIRHVVACGHANECMVK